MKDRCWGLILLCFFGLQAFAAEQPLDGTVRPVASSPDTVWYYQPTPVKVGKTEYKGFGFLKDMKGGQADGWVEFDVRGWDRFTAKVGLSDAWPAWQEDGSIIFFVDGQQAGAYMHKRGQAAQAIDIPLTGKSRLKIEMKIFVLLTAPTLTKLDPAVLDITSTPRGATILLDGTTTTKMTPCRLDMEMRGQQTREVQVWAILADLAAVKTVMVTAGQTTRCELTLEKYLGILPGTRAGEESINPKDGAMMVWVPAGEFLMGSKEGEGFSDERPQRRVYLNGYWIYKYEVTVAQYRKFCQATGRVMRSEPSSWKWQNTHPIANVSRHDATAYAAWARVALPTEAQWEKAARGTDGRIYPWGNTWDVEKCNNREDSNQAGGGKNGQQTAPVGSYPTGTSPYGCLDMAGNVWEWCVDCYDGEYYQNATARNPTGPTTGTSGVLRGGSWDNYVHNSYFRCADRYGYGNPNFVWGDVIGFRCVSISPEQQSSEP